MADNDTQTSEAGGSKPQPKIVPVIILIVLIAIAAGIWFFTHRGAQAPAPATKPTAAAGKSATPASPQSAPAAPTSAAPPLQTLSVDQLMQNAAKAFKEQRYVAPAGNNAVEFYLQVLVKDPKNQIAQDALREIFPFATGGVEQEINTGNLDEATREIDELSKVDPTNYTLTILRGKLDAKKKQVDNQQKQEAAAAAKAAAAKSAAAEQATQAEQAPAPPPKAAPKPAATPPPEPAPAPTEEKPPAPKGITRAAEIVSSPAPHYPPEAYRRHVSGWVEVTFTVTAKGTVSNASVTASQPNRLFDDAALEAVRAWTFKPRMENGEAVPEKMTRRIEFKLGG